MTLCPDFWNIIIYIIVNVKEFQRFWSRGCFVKKRMKLKFGNEIPKHDCYYLVLGLIISGYEIPMFVNTHIKNTFFLKAHSSIISWLWKSNKIRIWLKTTESLHLHSKLLFLALFYSQPLKRFSKIQEGRQALKFRLYIGTG